MERIWNTYKYQAQQTLAHNQVGHTKKVLFRLLLLLGARTKLTFEIFGAFDRVLNLMWVTCTPYTWCERNIHLLFGFALILCVSMCSLAFFLLVVCFERGDNKGCKLESLQMGRNGIFTVPLDQSQNIDGWINWPNQKKQATHGWIRLKLLQIANACERLIFSNGIDS